MKFIKLVVAAIWICGEVCVCCAILATILKLGMMWWRWINTTPW